MLVSFEFGSALLAGYVAARFFLSGETLRKILGIVLFLILLDEFLREGYFFHPSDILALHMTHEKAFLGFFVVGMAREGYQRYIRSGTN